MAQFVDPAPWVKLADALRETVALKGHALILGTATEDTGPGRIVLSPARGPFKPRAKTRAIIDVDLSIEAKIWGESDGHAWDLLVRLVRGVREHGNAGGPLVEWDDVDFDAEDDPSEQGYPCVVRFTLKAQPIEPAAPSTGLVEQVTLRKAD